MTYQITFYYFRDPNKLIHLQAIAARDYGEAYSKFLDEINQEVFILEIKEETAILN